MSWSVSFEIPKGSTEEQINEIITVSQATGNDDCPSERYDALMVAKLNLATILVSGVLGKVDEHGWRVSLSGHCNPNNQPREGFANDFIVLNVSQIA